MLEKTVQGYIRYNIRQICRKKNWMEIINMAVMSRFLFRFYTGSPNNALSQTFFQRLELKFNFQRLYIIKIYFFGLISGHKYSTVNHIYRDYRHFKRRSDFLPRSSIVLSSLLSRSSSVTPSLIKSQLAAKQKRRTICTFRQQRTQWFFLKCLL